MRDTLHDAPRKIIRLAPKPINGCAFDDEFAMREDGDFRQRSLRIEVQDKRLQ